MKWLYKIGDYVLFDVDGEVTKGNICDTSFLFFIKRYLISYTTHETIPGTLILKTKCKYVREPKIFGKEKK